MNSSIAFSRLAAVGRHAALAVEQQIGIGPVLVPADPAAQLVQVGQAVIVGLVDEDGVGVGDVQAALDDRRRHQDVGLVADELQHRLLPARSSAIWPWPIADLRLRHDRLQLVGDLVDVVDAVVDEVDLPVAVQLAQDGVADQLLDRSGRCASRSARRSGRRRFQVADVADAQQRQVQRPRDRRRRHRQHVDRLPQLLEPFLVLDAEALLLVDDDQAEVLELHVLRRPGDACR